MRVTSRGEQISQTSKVRLQNETFNTLLTITIDLVDRSKFECWSTESKRSTDDAKIPVEGLLSLVKIQSKE